MAGHLVNVNAEMNQMKQCIENVSLCKSKLSAIREEVWMYKTNYKANLLTIITTVYMIICALLTYNPILMGVGLVIAVTSAVLFFRVGVFMSGECICFSLTFGVSLCALVVSSIFCFMYMYNIVPVVIALVLWIVLVISNFRMRNQIWRISTTV